MTSSIVTSSIANRSLFLCKVEEYSVDTFFNDVAAEIGIDLPRHFCICFAINVLRGELGAHSMLWKVTSEEDFPQSLAIHRNLASGAIPELVFGRNEPVLIHYHQ